MKDAKISRPDCHHVVDPHKNCLTAMNPCSPSPVDRLKAHVSKWRETDANLEILQVIEFGYTLPLSRFPTKVALSNNASAKKHTEFVSSEIDRLLRLGCISHVNSVPHVVNPLTVSENSTKLRLVLDCRHINRYLHSFKFTLDDTSVARMLSRGK